MSTARKDLSQINMSPFKNTEFLDFAENEIPLDLSQISIVGVLT